MIKYIIIIRALLIAMFFLFSTTQCSKSDYAVGEDVEKLIKVHQLNENVILVHFGADVEIAFYTTKGIVVVDAGISNSLTAKFREAIEKEFNNNKVAYLINTHSHADHTGGNQVFSDVPIIGHQNCLEEMSQNTSNPEKSKVNLLKIVDEYDTKLKQFEPGSNDWNSTFTQKMRYKLAYDDLLSDRIVTYPTITFDDTLNLSSGDLTFNIIYFGRAHTNSDIMIHIPELKILLTGDLFYYGSNPSFGEYEKKDVERWLVAKEWYTQRLNQIETLIGGHGQIMDKEELKGLSEYIDNKWTELE